MPNHLSSKRIQVCFCNLGWGNQRQKPQSGVTSSVPAGQWPGKKLNYSSTLGKKENHAVHFLNLYYYFKFLFIDFREREEGRERERKIDLLCHLFMHSFVASCICCAQELNLQPWHIRTTL